MNPAENPTPVTANLPDTDGTVTRAMQRSVGKKVRLRVEGRDEPYEATVLDVQSDRDGSLLTLDIPDDVARQLFPSPLSVSLNEPEGS